MSLFQCTIKKETYCISNNWYSDTNTNVVLFVPKQDNEYLNKH